MNNLLQPFQDLARGAACSMRAALRRGALIGAALLIATLGASFLVFAGFLWLRFLFGPGVAALILGTALLGIATGVLLLAGNAERIVPPIDDADQQATPQTLVQVTSFQPADTATMAVFTAAFLLGRHLARQHDPSNNS